MRILIAGLAMFVLLVAAIGLQRWRGSLKLEALEKACFSGDASGCAFAGEELLDPRSPWADDARAAKALDRGCKLGSGDACAKLGYLMAYGRHGNDGVAGAVVLYDRACTLGSSLGCANLGSVLLEGGWGVVQDRERAVAAYEKACQLGDEESCDLTGGEEPAEDDHADDAEPADAR